MLTAPWLAAIALQAGPFGPGFWAPLWLVGGAFGLVALWSASFDQASERRARLRHWQWAGLAIGLAASLSLLAPSVLASPELRLPQAIKVVVALPIIATIRLVARYEGLTRERSTG
ncbi:MAG: hypothetical protein AMXMBFR57_15100 [Acidimicrobiia bacterium]